MEPFRPLVDRIVARLLAEGHPPDGELTRLIRSKLLEVTQQRIPLGGQHRKLQDCLRLCASSLVQSLRLKRPDLLLPDW